MPTTYEHELAREQAYVDVLYNRLDDLRDQAREQLRAVLVTAGTGTPQSRVEREAFADAYSDRIDRLDAAEERLCFGAMDRTDHQRVYIGRIGLSDTEHEPILIDWRAPVATAFYRATLADPHGLLQRRHLRAKGRELCGFTDDVLDPTAADAAQVAGASGDTPLLEALSAPRSGHMHDIVATLQAEQDRVIRADAGSVLVVDGGPGTGKTAVALHRAAYLLYTERERLVRSGVLVVGPSPVFLRYIEQVLPSLGETGVVFATPGRLFPGVDATGDEDARVSALKGDLRMATLVAEAVKNRQHVPAEGVDVRYDGAVLHLPRRTVENARTRARRSRRPHNPARRIFVRELTAVLTDQVIANLPGGLLDDDEREEIAGYVRADPAVRAVFDALWPRLTPRRLLADLFAEPARLAPAARAAKLTAHERHLLRRPADAPWTPADVPLLDEAAELLGDPDVDTAQSAERAATQERQAEREYAREVLDGLGLTGAVDVETMTAGMTERWYGPHRRRSAVEHASGDRSWTFGHLIVDEAQEVSPMLWRLLWRRCPMRSATLVGDLAQASGPAAAGCWAEALAPHIGDRWRLERLSVSYRTPMEIMDVAADVLVAQDPSARPPRSIRAIGAPPTAVAVDADQPGGGALVAAAAAWALRAAEAVGEGRVAVICPVGLPERVRAALAAAPAAASVGAAVAPAVPIGAADVLAAPIAVLTVAESKGLEFDAVVVAEPQMIIDGSRRGLADLYVALTRATRTLTVVHSGPLPAILSRLATERRPAVDGGPG
ncbi:HelD family protein [Protofrankia coriariae]|uniref:Helicase n=1 Tax=Protofrankia coriariae TaxID=1562887 RepID=A0ABR5F5P4_9ACTN|nr:ATP-binding domain-containing protein [Protofrankia coriariae]KLL12012.1 helicase [Protofrankia coriariae]